MQDIQLLLEQYGGWLVFANVLVEQAGLPVQADARAPLPLMRQVQLIAGGLVVLGAVLGATLSPWWHLLSGFVGGGLMVAGATGFCGMARLLLIAPWNRQG